MVQFDSGNLLKAGKHSQNPAAKKTRAENSGSHRHACSDIYCLQSTTPAHTTTPEAVPPPKPSTSSSALTKMAPPSPVRKLRNRRHQTNMGASPLHRMHKITKKCSDWEQGEGEACGGGETRC
jgi:hypothetical protein